MPLTPEEIKAIATEMATATAAALKPSFDGINTAIQESAVARESQATALTLSQIDAKLGTAKLEGKRRERVTLAIEGLETPTEALVDGLIATEKEQHDAIAAEIAAEGKVIPGGQFVQGQQQSSTDVRVGSWGSKKVEA